MYPLYMLFDCATIIVSVFNRTDGIYLYCVKQLIYRFASIVCLGTNNTQMVSSIRLLTVWKWASDHSYSSSSSHSLSFSSIHSHFTYYPVHYVMTEPSESIDYMP